jgi:hypothetical protein
MAAAVHVAFAARTIQLTKLGLIGHQAPGFLDFHPNPFVMSKTFGSVLQHVGLTEYIDAALHTIEESEVNMYVERGDGSYQVIVMESQQRSTI